MEPMTVVASDAHRGHDPPYEVNFGRVVQPVYERVARAELLREGLAAAGHPVVAPRRHGPGPLRAVHQPALLEFLERAWAEWRAAHGPRAALIPDTFALPGLGSGSARPPAGGVGRPRRFCFDTAPPLVEGRWPAPATAPTWPPSSRRWSRSPPSTRRCWSSAWGWTPSARTRSAGSPWAGPPTPASAGCSPASPCPPCSSRRAATPSARWPTASAACRRASRAAAEPPRARAGPRQGPRARRA